MLVINFFKLLIISDSSELLNGNEKQILTLIWSFVIHFQVQNKDNNKIDYANLEIINDKLKNWVNEKLAPRV